MRTKNAVEREQQTAIITPKPEFCVVKHVRKVLQDGAKQPNLSLTKRNRKRNNFAVKQSREHP